MKENRKLLREVLNDIRHDMTDEEVLNLLADSKISVKPESKKEKYTLGQRAADSAPPILLRNLPAAGRSSFPLQECLFFGWSLMSFWQPRRLIRILSFC